MSRRTVILLAIATGLLLTSAGGLLWFGPSGTGEFRPSPDGRYTAHAMNMSTGTLLGGRDSYVELRVVEQASGREVWRVVRRNPDGADVPDYGREGVRFITWEADSTSVMVPITNGQQLVLAVP